MILLIVLLFRYFHHIFINNILIFFNFDEIIKLDIYRV